MSGEQIWILAIGLFGLAGLAILAVQRALKIWREVQPPSDPAAKDAEVRR